MKEVIWILGTMALVVSPSPPSVLFPSRSTHLLPAKFMTTNFHVKGMARHMGKNVGKYDEGGT